MEKDNMTEEETAAFKFTVSEAVGKEEVLLDYYGDMHASIRKNQRYRLIDHAFEDLEKQGFDPTGGVMKFLIEEEPFYLGIKLTTILYWREDEA